MFVPNRPFVFLSFLRPAGKEARCGRSLARFALEAGAKNPPEKQSPTSAGKNFLLRRRRDGKIACWAISLYSRTPGRGEGGGGDASRFGLLGRAGLSAGEFFGDERECAGEKRGWEGRG